MDIREINEVHKVYDKISKHFSTTRKIIWPKVREFIDSFDSNSLILDVGCGNSKNMGSREDCKYIGLDMCENLMKHGEDKKNCSFVVGNCINLPFSNKFTDYSLTYSIFHYLPSFQYAIDCIYELIRVTKDNGRILIGDILDIKYKKSILLSDKKDISSKLPLIHRYSEWMFYDLTELVSKISTHKRVKKVHIIDQPEMLPFNSYRKDICICL